MVPALPAELAEGAGIIANRAWAIALGKAFFWDQQVGSDGQACASCHYNAGADSRITGELNPGFFDRTSSTAGDIAFGSNRSDTGQVAVGDMPGGAVAGTGTTLVPADFPIHRLQDETNRDAPIVSDTDDVVGSIGAYSRSFSDIDEDGSEHCSGVDAHIFHVSAADGSTLAARQVEPRNTPTIINAVFNVRQFWDGRASYTFNGVGPFGQRDLDGDPNLRLIVADGNGAPALGALALDHASLASQAVAPPTNSVEMSCAGRTFADLGRKLLRVAPLAHQHVAATDSVLGALAAPNGWGLLPEYSYAWLIQQAFDSKYWSLPGKYRRSGGALTADDSGYTQMETNLSMFWGLSILLYESTLISDRSEFDDLLASGDITTFPTCTGKSTVDPLLLRGCQIFFSFNFGGPPAPGTAPGAGCSACHAGTNTFSEGAIPAGGNFASLLQVADVNGVLATRDTGFSDLGSRAALVDIGLGGTDPYGSPLAFGRQYREYLDGGKDRSRIKDPFLLQAIDDGTLVAGFFPLSPPSKLEDDGAVKIPSVATWRSRPRILLTEATPHCGKS
jgi:cytochrome c peroxidase